MIRMLLMGYCYGRRSKRRLCDEVHLNLGYRLLCRLGLDGSAPDHATLSKVRHGGFREAELFRRVFERVVETYMGAGLVGGEGFAADALVIEADASYALRIGGPVLPPKRANPSTATRPVREYLAALNAARARRKGNSPSAWPGSPLQPSRSPSPTPPQLGRPRARARLPRGPDAGYHGERRGHASAAHRRGGLHPLDDRAHARALRAHAVPACRRRGLRHGPARL